MEKQMKDLSVNPKEKKENKVQKVAKDDQWDDDEEEKQEKKNKLVMKHDAGSKIDIPDDR
jgi:hypothetical protein